MIGILSYGGHIPRLRIDRMSIYQRAGWFAPATIMVAQGERAFCNWDEDPLTMAVAASRDCLVGRERSQVDGLFLCSTTMPFADRLNAGVVQTALDLRADMRTRDFAATQRAGTSGLVSALDTLRAGAARQLLVTASDQRLAKAAYFYEMWFGDGAASLLVGEGDDDEIIAEHLGSYAVSYDFVDHYRGALKRFDYMWEERWVRSQGYARIIPEAVQGLLDQLELTMDDVDKLVFPCFFKGEHRAIAHRLGAAPEKVADNLHEVCGETGAAHPLVMLVHTLERCQPGELVLAVGFGQGADALAFRVTEAINQLPARRGIRGCLDEAERCDNYEKFLKFRDLISTEMGIRAEAPTQTAMSVLWRKRKMILGLVGGRCTACGTPQFPRMEICVNPGCRATGTQEDYGFAERDAVVKTYTADLLAVSVDPPAIYGMVQFEGGGRMMADFSDCVLDDISVGQPVRMALRKRYSDAERGFTGYFWKALPLPVEEAADATEPEQRVRFDGRVAVVTGAGAGLGRCYALELAERGARVVVNDLGGAADGSGEGSARAADAVVAEIEALGGEAVASYDSVATAEGGQAIVQAALDTWGRIDVLVNNAGILRDRSMVKLEPPDWEAVLAVHLQGAYFVTRPAFAAMKRQGYGRIVMTTSAAGLFGNFGQSNYAAAKLGLVGLMNTLKLEGARSDVLVNTVAPIATTRLTEELLPPNLLDALQPEQIAPAVLYLCWEGCQTSGQIINAGAGHFSRAALVSAPGVVLGEGELPTVEDVKRAWEQVRSLEDAQEYGDAMSSLGPVLQALTGGPPPDEATAEDSGESTGVAGIFARMPSAFLADKAAGVSVVIQFSIGGEGGGDWNAVIADGSCAVSEGLHDAPTTTVLMDAADFVELIEGRLNAMAAFTTGKLKIKGDLMKSQLIEKLFSFRGA